MSCELKWRFKLFTIFLCNVYFFYFNCCRSVLNYISTLCCYVAGVFSHYSMPMHRLVHGRMTCNNEIVTANCHVWATLWKLWHKTGNSSLLATKCWPLLHAIGACSWRWPDVVAGFSVHFSKFAFVFLLYNKSLDDWSLGELWILFPLNLDVSLELGNIEVLEKQNSLFPSGSVTKC